MSHDHPGDTPGSILAVNAGSTSIKFSLFAAEAPRQRIFAGAIDGIGTAASAFHVDDGARLMRRFAIPDHVTAVRVLADWLLERLARERLVAIGHRVVYGGSGYRATQVLGPALLGALFDASSCDPDHLPQERLLIDTLRRAFPGASQVACFDTAFHMTMPPVASMLPIPRRFHAAGLVRLGFHGLSCASMMAELARLGGQEAVGGKVVLAHLGGGASMTAVKAGRSCDTSMGLTPAGGMMMATRSGDVDPGLGWRLAREHQVSAAQLNHMVNHDSGLKGVSGISGDLRVLLDMAPSEPAAAEAVDMFCYQARKQLCAMAGAMEGIDTLVFAGGVGEHLDAVRARICAGLGFLGIEIDPVRNAAHAAVISTARGAVTVRIMRTDEEAVIAQQVHELLGQAATAAPGAGA